MCTCVCVASVFLNVVSILSQKALYIVQSGKTSQKTFYQKVLLALQRFHLQVSVCVQVFCFHLMYLVMCGW